MNTQTAIITRQHWHAGQTKRPTTLMDLQFDPVRIVYGHCHLLNLQLWHALPVMRQYR
jgi:hypothetical protein